MFDLEKNKIYSKSFDLKVKVSIDYSKDFDTAFIYVFTKKNDILCLGSFNSLNTVDKKIIDELEKMSEGKRQCLKN